MIFEKINWDFLLGIIFGIAFITIGTLNNELTNHQYASNIGIFLMFMWLIGVYLFGIRNNWQIRKKEQKK